MPYTYKKEKGKYVVYKKSGEKVGTTGGTKEELKKYLAALHMHEPKKKMKKEAIEGSIDSVYAVQKPYSGCQLTSLVKPIDPLVGLGGSEVTPDTVHALYPDQETAQQVAETLYKEFQVQEQALEEKKSHVIEKIKKTMDVLERQRKESVDMIKENPKEADQHKQKVAHIATQIDDLVDKLKRIEVSKKQIEKDDKKKDAKQDKKKVEEALVKALKESKVDTMHINTSTIAQQNGKEKSEVTIGDISKEIAKKLKTDVANVKYDALKKIATVEEKGKGTIKYIVKDMSSESKPFKTVYK